MVVIEHDDEVVCVLKGDAGKSRSIEQVKEVKEKYQNKKMSVVGTEDSVMEISNKARALTLDGNVSQRIPWIGF